MKTILKCYYVRERINDVALSCPESIAREFADVGKSDQEQLWIICLNAKNQPIAKHLIALGGLDYSIISLRIVAKRALQSDAISIMLVHNHPSGECEPSNEDKKITKKIKDALDVLEIKVLDHIIVGIIPEKYYSFVEHREM